MMSKLCPLLIIGASGENPRGSMDCQEDLCQMWCDATLDHEDGSPIYLAGCGLMPKENRKVA